MYAARRFSCPNFFHPSTNRRMYKLLSNGLIGAPCGVPRPSSRLRVGRAYLGTVPSKKRVIRICEALSEMTGRDQTLLDQEIVVAKLNRTMIGWANHFGPVSAAYQAVDQHARNRLLQWLCAKHKLVWPAAKRFPETSLHEVLGLVCLTKRTSNLPWATS